jgi:hypothetical protein
MERRNSKNIHEYAKLGWKTWEDNQPFPPFDMPHLDVKRRRREKLQYGGTCLNMLKVVVGKIKILVVTMWLKNRRFLNSTA